MHLLKKLTPTLLFTTLLTLWLIACSPQQKSKAMFDDKASRTLQCIAQQSRCQFDLASGQVQILFDVDKILAEQSFTMVLNYKGAETLSNISGYLEGVDMFMGKIPLFIEALKTGALINNNGLSEHLTNTSTLAKIKTIVTPVTEVKQKKHQVFQTDVLVGSCSAEQMTWRVWLTFTTSDNKTYRKMLTIVSYRS